MAFYPRTPYCTSWCDGNPRSNATFGDEPGMGKQLLELLSIFLAVSIQVSAIPPYCYPWNNHWGYHSEVDAGVKRRRWYCGNLGEIKAFLFDRPYGGDERWCCYRVESTMGVWNHGSCRHFLCSWLVSCARRSLSARKT